MRTPKGFRNIFQKVTVYQLCKAGSESHSHSIMPICLPLLWPDIPSSLLRPISPTHKQAFNTLPIDQKVPWVADEGVAGWARTETYLAESACRTIRGHRLCDKGLLVISEFLGNYRQEDETICIWSLEIQRRSA